MTRIIRILGFLAAMFVLGCISRADIEAKRQAAEDEARTQRQAAEKEELARRYADLLDAGKKALEAKQFEIAVESFERAVPLQESPEARELLRQAHKARDDFRKQAFDGAMLRGEEAVKEKNYPAAVAAFRDALGNIRGDKLAIAALQEAEFQDFLERGRVALKNEQYADAVKSFAEVVSRRPDDPGGPVLLQQARTERRRQVNTG